MPFRLFRDGIVEIFDGMLIKLMHAKYYWIQIARFGVISLLLAPDSFHSRDQLFSNGSK
jgi:hypothetical protein